MANKLEKNPGNVPGPWYVDSSCIDCGMCPDTAPAVFQLNRDIGLSIAFHQPETEEERKAALEAMDECPTDSIGNDG